VVTTLVAGYGLAAAVSGSNSAVPFSAACAASTSNSSTATTNPSVPSGDVPGPTWLSDLHMVDPLHAWAVRSVDEPVPNSTFQQPVPEQVVVTCDGGVSWQSVEPAGALPGLVPIVGVFDAEHAWADFRMTAPGSSSAVYQSADGGLSWTPLGLDLPAGLGLAAITFIGDQDGFLLGVYGANYGSPAVETFSLWRTSDAGVTWTPVTAVPTPTKGGAIPTDCFTLGMGWSTPSTGWITGACPVGTPTEDQLLATHDGGRTWTPQPLPSPPGSAVDGLFPPQFSDSQDGVMAGVVGSGLPAYVTHDGGSTWRWEDGALPSPGTLVTINNFPVASTTSGVMVALLTDGAIAETSDGGQTWSSAGQHPEVSGQARGMANIDFVDATHGFISLSSGALYSTSDGGRTIRLVYQSPAEPLPPGSTPPA
jgi:photosystem II stability/assembly factor-like uncharacterized protein